MLALGLAVVLADCMAPLELPEFPEKSGELELEMLPVSADAAAPVPPEPPSSPEPSRSAPDRSVLACPPWPDPEKSARPAMGEVADSNMRGNSDEKRAKPSKSTTRTAKMACARETIRRGFCIELVLPPAGVSLTEVHTSDTREQMNIKH